MPKRLQTSDPGFEQAFVAFLGEKREVSADVDAAVATIVADVRARGDAALVELSAKFDRIDLGKIGMRVSAHEVRAAFEGCDKETIAALELARDRIEDHHRRQLPVNERYTDEVGVELGWRWTAVESAGHYVPGGLAT
jgi:histidinol dehydrogenase